MLGNWSCAWSSRRIWPFPRSGHRLSDTGAGPCRSFGVGESSIGLRSLIKTCPTSPTPAFRPLLDIDRNMPSKNVGNSAPHDLVHPDRDERAAAPHRFGIDVGVLTRNSRLDQGTDQATHYGSNTRPGERRGKAKLVRDAPFSCDPLLW
jgi:hypothetical protein